MKNSNINKSLADIIKDKNKNIKENENSEEFKSNPENFFMIIRVNIPLFEGIYEKYGELIDFIDIPGLDEVREINCFDDYILPIFRNILFPLFIFDVNTYSHDASSKILIQYLNYYYRMRMQISNNEEDNIFNKGFFILNKIDNLVQDNKEEIIKDFKNIFKEIKTKNGKIYIPFKENNSELPENNLEFNEFIAISAKKLINEEGSFINRIIEDIIQKAKNSQSNSFQKFIKDYLRKFNIDLNNKKEIDKMEETEELKSELKIINEHLEDELEDYNSPRFNIKEFIYIKQKLSNNKKSNENNLKDMLNKRIKLMIDDFLKFEFEEIKDIYNTRTEKMKELKINDNIDDIFTFIEDFNNNILNLFPKEINENFKKLKEMKNEINDFIAFKQKKKIRILFIGKISSGKTSLLNSLIGNNYNILQTTMKECTKSNFIIKNGKEISLFESKLVENKYGNYFEDIKISEIKGIDEVKKKIKVINENDKLENYYTLYIPIEPFDDKNILLNDNISNIFKNIPKDDIEIIDIPGIREDILSSENSVSNLKNLVNLCDGFIFTFADLKIEDFSSQLIFREILNFIKNKKESFNFNNCLFNLNFIDKIKSNEIKDKIKDFKDNIQINIIKNIYKGNLVEKLNLKDKIKSTDNINISYFSNKRYEKYQNIILFINQMEFLNFEDINNISFQKIYEDLSLEFNEIKINDNLLSNNKIKQKKMEIKNKIENIDPEKKMEIKNKIENIGKEEEIYIEKLSKLILSILDKKHELKIYKTSYADIFFNKFREQINNSYENNNQLIINKFSSYLYKILLKLYYIDTLCSNKQIMKIAQENIEIKKKIIIKKYDEFIGKVKNEFSDIIKYLNEIEIKLSIIINKDSNIYDIIEEYKLDDLIKNLTDKISKEIKEMNTYYYDLSINQISELVKNEGQFISITQTIFKFNKNNEPNSFFDALSLIPIIVFKSYKSAFIRLLSKEKPKKNSLSMIFKDRKDYILYNRDKYIEEIIAIRDIFINELNNTKNISLEEINYLNSYNFHSKFKDFINLIENKLIS